MNYTVAMIFEVGTDWPFDEPMIGPAIDIGKNVFLDILKDRIDINFNFIQIKKKEAYRTCSAEGYASLVAGLYFRDHVDGFIGPVRTHYACSPDMNDFTCGTGDAFCLVHRILPRHNVSCSFPYTCYYVFTFVDTWFLLYDLVVSQMGTDWPFDEPMIGPAIDIGKNVFLDILKDRIDINFNFIQIKKKEAYRTCSAEGYASLVAGLYFRDHVDGFIGPAISYVSKVHAIMNYSVAIIFEVETDWPFDEQMIGPAIDIGKNVFVGILKDRMDINFIQIKKKEAYRTCSAEGYASLVAGLYFRNNVDGFIGPGCGTALEACGRMCSDWHLPLITPVGTTSIVSDKRIYKTLTRMSYNMDKFTKFYRQTLMHFNWTDVAIIYDEADFIGQMFSESIDMAFSRPDSGINLTMVPFNPRKGRDEWEHALIRASEVARVFLLKCFANFARDLLLTAQRLGKTNGEYVYIFLRIYDGDTSGDIGWKRNDSFDDLARKAYESLFVIQCRIPPGEKFSSYDTDVKERALRDYNYDWEGKPVNIFIVGTTDSFILYATAINDTINDGENPHDGRNVMKRMWNRHFEGIAGTVLMDVNGDREVDVSLLDLTDPPDNTFKVLAHFIGEYGVFRTVPGVDIHWPNNHGPPVNRPRCGFRGESLECQTFDLPLVAVIGIAFGVVLLVIAIIGILIYRKMRLETELHSLWWKVKWEDVVISTGGGPSKSLVSTAMVSSQHVDGKSQISLAFTQAAVYKGTKVVIKKIPMKHLTVDRQLALELKQMRDVNSPHLTRFCGLCPNEPNICILTEHCSRGSLEDILQNDSIQLDRDFKISLVSDIVEGMAYIHNGPLSVHGRLNSSNCVIDSRFVLKITDFGLMTLRRHESTRETKRYFVWVAPEHLRTDPHRDFSQPGDVYSFSIILFEMLTRCEPYQDEDTLDLEGILEKVKAGALPPYRPTSDLLQDHQEPKIIMLLQNCWNEDYYKRPTFSEIRKTLKACNWAIPGGNVFDTLMKRMEQYANNLEGLVEERTIAFLDEKRKAEELLYHILPKSVADKLKNGIISEPEWFDSVSIYFSDIVGFTNLSARSTPMQIVDFLNDLYTCFDAIIGHFDVYKVETIGDAYMVVSGLPVPNGSEHARQIARMSLSLLSNVTSFKVRHEPTTVIKVRIGLHSGSVCAGVVGTKMPRFCLFGDTVNTASRMESNGEAMKIHASQSFKTILETFGSFLIEKRGDIEIKGKGTMTTYWIIGEDNLPNNP
ncbi:hypothetical protein ScPMuIL_002811 [Solemya velum]